MNVSSTSLQESCESDSFVKVQEDKQTTETVDNSSHGPTAAPLVPKLDLPNATENELINLDDIDFSDEDTWLYTPPKSLSSEEKGLSPYKWLRQDVEDPNNRELQMAKTALVSKLEELDILKSVQRSQSLKTKPSSNDTEIRVDAEKSSSESLVSHYCEKRNDLSALNTDLKKEESNKSKSSPSEINPVISENETKFKLEPLNDVTDVFERARQQEESLKQSSSRFFSQSVRTLPRSKGSLPCSASVTPSRLSKPASVEALHLYSGRSGSAASPTKLQPKSVIPSPSVSPYNSMVSLSFVNDGHRGSLPNLNKSYHTLKSKKNKRTSEPKIQCPLPVYPKPLANGGTNEATRVSTPRSTMHLPAQVCGESQTLPSSFRTKSRRSLNDTVLCNTLSRRESDPQSQCQKNSLKAHLARRDSMPTSLIQAKYNSYPRKSLQTVNQTQYSEYLSSPVKLKTSRTGSVNPLLPAELMKKDAVTKDYPPRRSSNSPVKRQPLTSVHNRSPNTDDSSVSASNSLRKPSLPSKIPSPASRSGIPVPSQFIDRAGSCTADDNWSQDSY